MVLQRTDFTSEITDEELREFTSEYYIPFALHPVVPAASASIADFPEGKIGVYTRFFEFANRRVPLSLFMCNILNHYRLHISQLHCIGAAKITNFEVNCRPVHLFRAFYHTSWTNGWVSFSKRAGPLQCYTEKLDALRRWREMFFWVDDAMFPWDFAFYTPFVVYVQRPESLSSSYFPIALHRRGKNNQFQDNALVPWDFVFYTQGSLPRDERPPPGSYSMEDAKLINENRIPINAYSEAFLCHMGISRNYFQSPEEVPTFIGDDGRGGCLSFLLPRLVVARARGCCGVQGKLSLGCEVLGGGKNNHFAGLDEFRQRVGGLLEKQEEKLRKLSIEYDEELYPHMLSAIAERRWLISHGLRLAAMSTLESQEVKRSLRASVITVSS
ncbi:hypothetical protein Tco_1494782 [Tanacetum coccineum]